MKLFKKRSYRFPQWLRHFTPSSNAPGFQFLHTVTTCYFPFIWLVILMTISLFLRGHFFNLNFLFLTLLEMSPIITTFALLYTVLTPVPGRSLYYCLCPWAMQIHLIAAHLFTVLCPFPHYLPLWHLSVYSYGSSLFISLYSSLDYTY